MDVVSFYAAMAFVVMVVLAIVNSKLKVESARPLGVATVPGELPLYFAHQFRDFSDYGLIRAPDTWKARMHQAFGDGDQLYEAGEALRLLSRPGRSLLAAATACFVFKPGWSAEEIEPAVRAQLDELGLEELTFRLDDLESTEEGWRCHLVVGPWSRELTFTVPGDVFREANALLEADGYRIMQFDTANLVHAFCVMHLPLARKAYESALFEFIDPCGGEELDQGGAPEQWSTWLY